MRLRVDGAWVEIGEVMELDRERAHDVDIVIDRLERQETRSRIAEAVSSALEMGKGFFSICNPDTEEETIFSQYAYSPKSGLSYGPLEPHDFSFNHPAGCAPLAMAWGSQPNSI